jgi:hypothetical protein
VPTSTDSLGQPPPDWLAVTADVAVTEAPAAAATAARIVRGLRLIARRPHDSQTDGDRVPRAVDDDDSAEPAAAPAGGEFLDAGEGAGVTRLRPPL